MRQYLSSYVDAVEYGDATTPVASKDPPASASLYDLISYMVANLSVTM